MTLLTRSQIAELAGTTPGMVDAWRQRHADFPEPVRVDRRVPYWDAEAIAIWLARPRKTGRPRKTQ